MRRESENSVQDNLEGRASLHEIELGDDALAAILKEHGTWVESGGVAGVRAELPGHAFRGELSRGRIYAERTSVAQTCGGAISPPLMSGATPVAG